MTLASLCDRAIQNNAVVNVVCLQRYVITRIQMPIRVKSFYLFWHTTPLQIHQLKIQQSAACMPCLCSNIACLWCYGRLCLCRSWIFYRRIYIIWTVTTYFNSLKYFPVTGRIRTSYYGRIVWIRKEGNSGCRQNIGCELHAHWHSARQ